jgi:hypothetical protein
VFATPVADRVGLKVSSVLAAACSALIMTIVATMPRLNLPLLAGLVAMTGTIRAVGDRTKHVLLQPMADAAGAPIIRVTAGYETLDKTAQLPGAPPGGVLSGQICARPFPLRNCTTLLDDTGTGLPSAPCAALM